MWPMYPRSQCDVRPAGNFEFLPGRGLAVPPARPSVAARCLRPFLATAAIAALAAALLVWSPLRGQAVPGLASQGDAVELFRSRSKAAFPWEAHIVNLTQGRFPGGLPGDLVPAGLKAMDRRGQALQLRQASAGETVTDEYLRVSTCIADTSLASLKLGAAVLSIEGSAIVCPKAHASYSQSLTAEAEGTQRRLATPYGATAGIRLDSKELAQMGCAANLQGVISSFTAVSQYISQAVYQCPFMVDTATENGAGCSMAISVLLSGITKSSSAAGDIAQQCRDPAAAPYSIPIIESRRAGVRAACLINIGQASTYLAKVGLSINGIVDHCKQPGATPNNAAPLNWYEQAVCGQEVAGEFANIGQVATYLAGAASDCGDTILVPFACANRVAAVVTGFGDITQGAFGIKQHCVPSSLRPKTTTSMTPSPTNTAAPLKSVAGMRATARLRLG